LQSRVNQIALDLSTTLMCADTEKEISVATDWLAVGNCVGAAVSELLALLQSQLSGPWLVLTSEMSQQFIWNEIHVAFDS